MSRDFIRNEWFKDHVAKITTHPPSPMGGPDTTWIEWRKPGTWNYGIVYCIAGYHLIVTGDLGSAVYRWQSNLSLKFLAGLDLSYFESKCEASEHGRDNKEWDERVAAAEFKRMLLEFASSNDEDFALFQKAFWADHANDDKDPDDGWEKLTPEQKLPWQIKALQKIAETVDSNGAGYRHMAEAFLELTDAADLDRIVKDATVNQGSWHEFINGDPLDMGDLYECGDMGMVVSNRCESHLVGLKMAWEQTKIPANPQDAGKEQG